MKKRNHALLLFLLVFLTGTFAKAQDNNLIQFSGVVVSGDGLKPVPYTNIIIKNTYRGTVSDFYGFFSFEDYTDISNI